MTSEPHPSSEERTPRKAGRQSLGLYALLAIIGVSAGAITARLILTGQHESRGGPVKIEGMGRTSLGIGGLDRLPAPREVPDLSFTGTDGREHRLSDWRGKVVLVNLWATWCTPCREEMPSLDRLQAMLGGDGFAVLVISTDRTGPERPAEFFTKAGIKNLEVYNDKTSASLSSLGAEGLPFTIILDPQGREIAQLTGPASWDSPEATVKLREFINGSSG